LPSKAARAFIVLCKSSGILRIWTMTGMCSTWSHVFRMSNLALSGSRVCRDGRTIGMPLAWFPRRLDASPEQRAAVTLGARGLSSA
jgi:hypothetical protein